MKEFNPEELFKNIEDIEVLKKLPSEYLYEKTVLGIDIYKYSQYPTTEQVYIPVLFKALYDVTVNNVFKFEQFIFNSYKKETEEFKKNFISTGDGGFQIFDNPIQAIIFSLYFQMNVKRYCSGASKNAHFKKLYKIIDSIDLRYAVTIDIVYSYQANFFGPAIINNARILSKDSLNRLLVDSNTIKWFNMNINSIENLMDLDINSLLSTTYFRDYNPKLKSILFNDKSHFKSVDVQKIGRIEAKFSSLDIFNLHIQTLIKLQIEKHDYNTYIVTLGNLNTRGIE